MRSPVSRHAMVKSRDACSEKIMLLHMKKNFAEIKNIKYCQNYLVSELSVIDKSKERFTIHSLLLSVTLYFSFWHEF